MELGVPEEIEAWSAKVESEEDDEPYGSEVEEEGSSDYENEDSENGEKEANEDGKPNYLNGYYHEIYQTAKPTKQEDVPVRDWNEEFQSIRSQLANCTGSEEEKLRLYNQLSNLAHGMYHLSQTMPKTRILSDDIHI